MVHSPLKGCSLQAADLKGMELCGLLDSILQLVHYTPCTAFKLLDMMIQEASMPDGEPKGGGVLKVHHKMCV